MPLQLFLALMHSEVPLQEFTPVHFTVAASAAKEGVAIVEENSIAAAAAIAALDSLCICICVNSSFVKDPVNGPIMTQISMALPALECAVASAIRMRPKRNSMMCKHGFGVLLLGVSTWLSGPAHASEQYVAYFGVAASQRSDQLLYGESHVVRYQNGRIAERVVLYTCPDGTPFARKHSTYEDPLAPNFVFEDVSNGMREGVRAGANPKGNRTVFFRGFDGKPEKSAPVSEVPGLVIDSGFDEFIRSNWQTLMTQGSLSLQFLVPSRLETLGFQLQHLRTGNEDGTPTEVFRLKLQGILGWIAPNIDVTYSERDHVLMRYEGLSDLRDKSGDNLRVDITFRLSDRKPSDAAAAAAAMSAPLLACR